MRISDWSSDVCSSDLIRGCVPKKLLSYAAHFHEDFADAAGFGWTVEGARFDWATLIANKDKEIDRLEIGRAHVRTPVNHAHLVCSLMHEKKKNHQSNPSIPNHRRSHSYTITKSK